MFCIKILLILLNFHGKTLSSSADTNQNFYSREEDVLVHSPPPLPPFMDKVLSEERQILKWVGIFKVGLF